MSNNSIKKAIAIALSLSLSISFKTNAHATEIVDIKQNNQPVSASFISSENTDESKLINSIISGSCNDGVYWNLDVNTGILTISGTGAIPYYSYYSNFPWNLYKNYIKAVFIEDGITYIPDNAFFDCNALTNITIPDSVKFIGENAFGDCKSLINVKIPNSLISTGKNAFIGCNKLVNFNFEQDDELFKLSPKTVLKYVGIILAIIAGTCFEVKLCCMAREYIYAKNVRIIEQMLCPNF